MKVYKIVCYFGGEKKEFFIRAKNQSEALEFIQAIKETAHLE